MRSYRPAMVFDRVLWVSLRALWQDESWIAVSTARFLQIGRKYNRFLKDSHALDTIVQAIEDDLHPDVATIVEQIRALATL